MIQIKNISYQQNILTYYKIKKYHPRKPDDEKVRCLGFSSNLEIFVYVYYF